MGLKVAAESFTRRPPLHHQDLPFVLFWSEKSGCTIAVKWFFHQLGLLQEALDYHPWIHNYENEVFRARRSYNEECIAALNDGKPAIKIVRNPYSRAFSGYLELCRPFLTRQNDHWAYEARQRVLEYLVGYAGEIELAFSFNQFVSWLEAQDIRDVNDHIAPQRLPYEAQLEIEPLKLEDGHAIFAELEERFGLKATTQDHVAFNSGHHHAKTELTGALPVDISDLAIPVQRNRSFRLIAPTPVQLSQGKSGDALRRLFAGDFAAYRYEE